MSDEENKTSEKPKLKVIINTDVTELNDNSPTKYRLFLTEQAMEEIAVMQEMTGTRDPARIIEEALAYYNFCCEVEQKGYKIKAKKHWWSAVSLVLFPSKVRIAMAAFRKEQETCKKTFKPKVVT